MKSPGNQMTQRQRVSAKQRPGTGGIGTEDRADVIERESEASVPAKTTSEEAVRQALDMQLKRVYEPSAAADGIRILVDRLWPRGLTKAEAAIDRWMRDLAPSTDLRRWFGHDPSRWDEFRREYARELRAWGDLLEEVRSLARRGRVTLLFGARDERHNDAVVLREVLLK
jgi:uncharacterized protein YeaO (DUF488 family)